MKTRKSVALLFAGALLVGACGSSSSGDAASAPTTPSTDGTSPAAGTSPAIPEPDGQPDPSDVALASVVLTIDDVPAGFTPSTDDDSDDDQFCEALDEFGSDSEVFDEAESEFENLSTGEQISSGAFRFADEATAESELNSFGTALEACAEGEATFGGTPVTFRFQALEIPDELGPFLATDLYLESAELNYNLELIIFQRDEVLVMITSGAIDAVDSTDQTVAYAETVLNRL